MVAMNDLLDCELVFRILRTMLCVVFVVFCGFGDAAHVVGSVQTIKWDHNRS